MREKLMGFLLRLYLLWILKDSSKWGEKYKDKKKCKM